ncbi:hypothetical protein BDY19DRAFT_902221 [Irpex rosettiformis]|uniref:Uncharacterized protein n=1 Tax=Irpex rosettiformis TaxID=378272 RepID=A0ACB8ULI0_9APHY|nr:hypothetical protein BDY19DRAFT_902221 [Irpex rosettiformis]
MSHHWRGVFARANELVEESKSLYPLLGANPVALINANFILVTFGQVSLVLLLGTLFFSPYVRSRNATLLNLLALTIFQSVPPGILYYSGHVLDPNPQYGLCLAQAMFKHGSDPMFITASLALIVELLVETRLLDIRLRGSIRTALLVALPYFVFFVFFFWALILGEKDPSAVRHQLNQFYCIITYTSFGRGIDILNAVVVVFTIGLEIFTHFRYRQIFRDTRASRSGGQSGFSTALVIRLLGFTLLQLFYICLLALNFFVGSAATHVIPIAYEASMPLATFLIFGTTADCLQTWAFWKRREDPTSRPSTPNGFPRRDEVTDPVARDLRRGSFDLEETDYSVPELKA